MTDVELRKGVVGGEAKGQRVGQICNRDAVAGAKVMQWQVPCIFLRLAQPRCVPNDWETKYLGRLATAPDIQLTPQGGLSMAGPRTTGKADCRQTRLPEV